MKQKQAIQMAFLILIASLFLLGLGVTRRSIATSVHSSPKENLTAHQKHMAQSAKVSIEIQPDAPLAISVSELKSIDPFAPEFNFTIMNRSLKDISAYAVRYEALSNKSTSGGMTLASMSLADKTLQPGDSHVETIEGIYFSDPVKNIILSVDYIEFADGTSWGPDLFRSFERLNGQRAELRAAAEFLLGKLNKDDLAAVTKANESDEDEILPPLDSSSAWLDGFRSGKSTMRERIRQISKKREYRVS